MRGAGIEPALPVWEGDFKSQHGSSVPSTYGSCQSESVRESAGECASVSPPDAPRDLHSLGTQAHTPLRGTSGAAEDSAYIYRVADPSDPRYRDAYACWKTMKARCQNPNHPNFPAYGGRGIRVCDTWQTYAGFMQDMGIRPPGATIDRIDNDGHYEAANCRWATRFEQAQNRRDTSQLTMQGRTQSVTAWCREYSKVAGIPTNTIRSRIDAGLTWDEAARLPVVAKYSRSQNYGGPVVRMEMSTAQRIQP